MQYNLCWWQYRWYNVEIISVTNVVAMSSTSWSSFWVHFLFPVFFLTKNEDEDYSYSRSESIGMTCLNKFAIDEENQNEITGVHFIKPWQQNSTFDKDVIRQAIRQSPRAGINWSSPSSNLTMTHKRVWIRWSLVEEIMFTSFLLVILLIMINPKLKTF